MAPKKSIAETYQKKTQLEHILDIPDTYIGSVEEDKYDIYIYDESINRMTFKTINFIPGLFKIYDEIIVNAFDQYVRLNSESKNDNDIIKVKKIDITLNKETGEISVLNDGNGIDVVMHPDHNIYIPSMIFGELLTSTNYNKDDKKITGGKNGYGAKLTNIYSTQFHIETIDHIRSLKFSQTFYDNMSRSDPPKVKASKVAPYTLVKFKPDYKRFKCEDGLTEDMYDVMVKRVYDLSACTSSNVIVSLNGKKIEYKNFEEYVDLYIGPKSETPRIYEKVNDRWEIALALNDNFEQISFVNGVNTIKGGKHVEYVLNQVIKGVIDEIEKKKKVKVKPNVIKDMLIIFVKATIENPSFDSQTKETLTTTSSKFGSKCDVSDTMIKNLCKMGIIDRAISISEIKDNKDLKKTDGKKTTNIRGIPKLDDANDAGGKNSASCTLILTEGDSAKSMAIAGLSVVGRDKFGVFPLRGKILNVQDISVQKIADNEEISNLKKIIGLESNKTYEDINKLRYGKIMIMTDQDSVTGDTPLVLRKNGLIEIKTIEDLVKPDDFKSIINEDRISSKEYGHVEYEVWTEKGWTKIKHVMRHMVEKDIYRVLTHTGIVDVTEDHSLLNKNAQKITPKECVVGGELLHSFPLFEENNTCEITPKDSYNLGLLYSKNSNEFIPNEILNSNKLIIEAFLKGYFENNDINNESFIINIESKISSQSIYYLCKSLGYEVSINHQDKKNSIYTLNITKGTQQDNPNRIKKIFNLGKTKQYVYDLETENHHFQAGVGQLICHNTDGHHIKGLLFNIFKNMWPSLLKIDGFMSAMMTPIVKVSKGNQKIPFITLQEFETWRQANNGGKGWDVKYYKGLGTSTTSEAKEYFEIMNVVNYECNDNSFDALDLAFNKTRADDRKNWLSHYDRNKILDISNQKVNYEDFINNELIHFSNNDLERSIPSMCDGLKVSTRKILYCCFKRKLYYNKKEIRVAQLAGYVSEHSAYHHGEASLQGAIIGMAQNFVCSNNINLLMPNGQYGCLDPETPVLLWDGSIELAKNIKIGDKLMGDDGTCRNVLQTVKGEDEMYEIYNGNMDKYVVNSKHILTLHLNKHKKIYWKKNSNSWAIDYIDHNTNRIKSKSFNSNFIIGNGKRLKMTKEKAYECALEFSKTISDNKIFDINIEDYLALTKDNKKYLKGILNTSVMNWNQQETLIDPYILGMWLGDGHSDGHAFASMDSELVKEWCLWLDNIGCEVCHNKNIPPHESHTFYIRRKGSSKGDLSIGDELHSRENCKGCLTSKHIIEACDWHFNKNNIISKGNGKNINGRNVVNLQPFKELLKKDKVFNNKHVPDNYLYNNEENRLKILAGMIDTDGCLKNHNGCYAYSISQCFKRIHLLESFRIIAGSLGFRAKINKAKKNIYELYISGENINKIPVKLERKKIPHKNNYIVNPMTNEIKINSIGKGQFCGWSVDKNERFLLGDFTITHNSRLQNGSDSASPRYIHTLLNKLSTIIFKEEDNAILRYLDDDGYKIEPEYYVPILPMILVNGAIGIGTGYSTNIPCYNPLEIVSNLKLLLVDENSELNKLKPWYMGFKGQILDLVNNSYITKGNYRIIDNNTVEITELPIGLAIEDYKEFLEDMIIDNDKDKEKEKDNKDKKKKTVIKKRYLVSYENHCSESNIKFMLNLERGCIKELDKETGCGYTLFEKEFKLISSKLTNINNMHLYDKKGIIKKYNNVQEIIKDFYEIRLEFYVKRKEYILRKLERELKILASKVRFINDVVEERLKIGKKKKEELKEYLEINKYPKICDKKKVVDNSETDDNDTGIDVDIFNDDEEGTYDYLLRMPVYTLTIDNREEILKQKLNKEEEIDNLKNKTVKKIWEEELNEFIIEYKKYYDHHMNELFKNSEMKPNKKKVVKASISGSKKK